MKEQLEKIKAQAMQALESVSDLKLLDELRVKYLGKKGELTAVLRGMARFHRRSGQRSVRWRIRCESRLRKNCKAKSTSFRQSCKTKS